MKFGLALPNSGPLASPANIRRVAEEAEALGYDALLVHDHVSYDTEWLGHRTSGLTEPHAGISPDLYESVVTLSFAAAATSDGAALDLGAGAAAPRPPGARAPAHYPSGAFRESRLSLGIGSGDYPADFRVMEIPYSRQGGVHPRVRGGAVRAASRRPRWTFQGDTIRIDRGAFFPETAPIPLLMGGGIRPNPSSGVPELFEPPLRVLARWCHGWIPEGPPEVIREGVARDLARLACTARRRVLRLRFEIRAQSPLYIGDDDEAGARS